MICPSSSTGDGRGCFGNPHAILYRRDRNRLFVTDGDGALRIFDATAYRAIKNGR
jgi:hypothetical protein